MSFPGLRFQATAEDGRGTVSGVSELFARCPAEVAGRTRGTALPGHADDRATSIIEVLRNRAPQPLRAGT
ncbi:hypothetical protein EAO77_29350 [Streptomyces sp. t39]|nr:hypothetical protein EAO77_29350 [Streptomyces sp. t39]